MCYPVIALSSEGDSRIPIALIVLLKYPRPGQISGIFSWQDAYLTSRIGEYLGALLPTSRLREITNALADPKWLDLTGMNPRRGDNPQADDILQRDDTLRYFTELVCRLVPVVEACWAVVAARDVADPPTRFLSKGTDEIPTGYVPDWNLNGTAKLAPDIRPCWWKVVYDSVERCGLLCRLSVDVLAEEDKVAAELSSGRVDSLVICSSRRRAASRTSR